MKPARNLPAFITSTVISFAVMFAAGILILYPSDIWRSLATALAFSLVLAALDRFIQPTGDPVKIAARIQHLLTARSLPSKKDRAKKAALIALFFIGFTVINMELLRFVTGGGDPGIFLASPIVGALYTYGFIAFLRKHQNRKNSNS